MGDPSTIFLLLAVYTNMLHSTFVIRADHVGVLKEQRGALTKHVLLAR